MYKIVVLASNGGGNFEAVVKKAKEYNYVVSKLIVNKECPAIEKAKVLGVPYSVILAKGEELFQAIDNEIPSSTDLIVLGGFMPIVPAWFCDKWKKKIINIHPSLLPAYGGKGMYGVHVQEAVMAAHEKYAGCTVHYVDSTIDGGEILEQWKMKVDYSLTPWQLGGEIFDRGTELLTACIRTLVQQKYKSEQ